MIYPETVELTISTRVPIGGGVYDTIITKRTVAAAVTFLDSSKLINTQLGTNLLESRFRIYLSPYGEAIPAKNVTLTWKQFASLIVEGLIEPHYVRGRLHHYECVARG